MKSGLTSKIRSAKPANAALKPGLSVVDQRAFQAHKDWLDKAHAVIIVSLVLMATVILSGFLYLDNKIDAKTDTLSSRIDGVYATIIPPGTLERGPR